MAELATLGARAPRPERARPAEAAPRRRLPAAAPGRREEARGAGNGRGKPRLGARQAPRPGGRGRLPGSGRPGHPGALPGGGGLRRLPGFVRAASPWAARRRLMREPAQLGSAPSAVPPRESRSR